MDQEKLRERTKLAKALNDDIYYKDFAEYLEIKENSFYNWLNRAYKLSEKNYKALEDIVNDLLD